MRARGHAEARAGVGVWCGRRSRHLLAVLVGGAAVAVGTPQASAAGLHPGPERLEARSLARACTARAIRIAACAAASANGHPQAAASALRAPLLVGGTGAISGHVTAASDKKPVQEVEVCAEATGRLEGEGGRCVQTDTNGEYTIKELPPGAYTVEFDGRNTGRNLRREYYSGRTKLTEADPVTVQAGQTTKEVNAAMQPGAQISGEVSFTGAPPTFVEICASPVDEVFESGNCSGTEPDGKYTINSLNTGAYIVGFVPSPPYAPQFYSDELSLAEASLVTTKAGTTTPNVNASLSEGGTVSGTVRDAKTGALLKEALVCPEALGFGRLDEVECVSTDEAGNYEVKGQPSGGVVLFASGPLGDYASQAYENAYDFLEADPLQVPAGGEIHADFQLVRGGTISGQVTSALTKTPLQDVDVCADEPERSGPFACETTTASGAYTLEGLAPGSYVLEFRPDDESGYVTQYYNAKTAPGEAERIVVGGGAEIHANASLSLGGSISGLVTAAGGQTPIAGVVVCAWFTTEEEIARCEETEANGHYLITGLAGGRYKVEFEDFFGELNILPQFFSGRASYGEADTVTVTSNLTTQNVNATLGQGGEITGTLSDAETELPIWGYIACAYEGDGEEAGCGETDDEGAYTISSLATGSYRVRFRPAGFPFAGSATRFADQFYSHAPSESSASPVTVSAGAVTSGIDGSLKASARPVAARAPVVIGSPTPGTTLSEGHASWLNGVPAIAYQWERCDAGKGPCEAIAGADARHYTVAAADEAHRLRVSETAVNTHGASQPEHSFRTGIVPGAPPPGGGSEPPPSKTGGSNNSNNSSNGTPGGGGTLSATSNLPSGSQILGALASSLVPTGKEARIAALRKHGGYKLTFLAPSAGQLVIGWYQVPKGAHISRPKPLLLASGKANASKSGRLTIVIKLTAKGRALLKHGGKLKLTAKGTFTPVGGRAVSATRTFTLR